MGCGPLPDWLRKKSCIYSIDTFDDNLCAWRCLAIYKRKDIQRGAEFVTRTTLDLAREYYGYEKLERNDVKPAKLVDFEDIAKHHNVNIMLHEPKKDRGKDSGSIWRLVYGKVQYKNDLPTINMGLLGGHFFYIKKTDVNNGIVRAVGRYFIQDENLIRHLKEERCTEGKTKIVYQGGKFRHISNSSEKVFYYGDDTKFSYTACQWTEAQTIETGKHIHHKMCSHGGERMVNVWVLNDKGKQTPVPFMVDGYEPETH